MILPFACLEINQSLLYRELDPSQEEGWRQKEKEKVVAAACGAALILFLATLAYLHQDGLKNRMNCTRTIWRIGWIEFIPFFKSSLRDKELNQFCPPKSSDDHCLLFCLYSSSMWLTYPHPRRCIHRTVVGRSNGQRWGSPRTETPGQTAIEHSQLFLLCNPSLPISGRRKNVTKLQRWSCALKRNC